MPKEKKQLTHFKSVVEAFRLEGYDDFRRWGCYGHRPVVEAFRLEGYDDFVWTDSTASSDKL